MWELLAEKGHTLSPNERSVLIDIKEKLCAVAIDFNSLDTEEKSYEFIDGQNTKIGSERFRCPEALFKPTLIELECEGIVVTTHRAITTCDVEIKRDLYSNIVLSGGTTLFPGMAERLQKDISSLVSFHLKPKLKVSVVAPPKRKHSTWFGGSILASLSAFQDMWITKAQYEEGGPSVVHRKCF